LHNIELTLAGCWLDYLHVDTGSSKLSIGPSNGYGVLADGISIVSECGVVYTS